MSAALSFEQPVPRRLAHRRAAAEVFVCDTAEAGPGEYLAAVQVPRSHLLWFDRPPEYHDPLGAVEAIRQALTVIGHRHGGVGDSDPGSLQRLEFWVEDLGAFRDAGTPLEGVVRVRRDSNDGGGFFTETGFEARLTVGDVPALTLRASGVLFPRDAYEEFRRAQRAGRPEPGPGPARPDRPVEPARVGRRDGRNVVVGEPESGRVPLLVDQGHPSLFDHPYDHVPGPLMLEGFRQAAILTAVAGGLLDAPESAPTGAEAEFTGFAELDAPLTIEAAARAGFGGGAEVEVGLEQYGTRIAKGRVELSAYPGRDA
ncbi:AfsA-related hotdog domain-containing protein [Actinomadura chokoriensis]|uniref:AfsA-related hotdog domain-containing protein n=1 Tax=Actinomadura chokoriensis TaxID=454156 RepID=A0ABV4R3I6_9ACTN